MPNAPRRRGGGRETAARPPAANPAPVEAADAESAPAPDHVAPREGRPRRGTSRTLSDGRVQMLVYLPPALVKAVKRVALEQDTSASHVVEQALGVWFAREPEPAGRNAATRAPPAPPTPAPTAAPSGRKNARPEHS